MCVALVLIDARMELAAKTRGPVLQFAETTGDASEFIVTGEQSSQGDVLMLLDDTNGSGSQAYSTECSI